MLTSHHHVTFRNSTRSQVTTTTPTQVRAYQYQIILTANDLQSMSENHNSRQDIPDETETTKTPPTPLHPPRRGNTTIFFSLWLLWIASINLEISQKPPMMTAVSAMRTVASTTLRRSRRLSGISPHLAVTSSPEPDPPKKSQKRKASSKSLQETKPKATKKKKNEKPKTKKTREDSTAANEMWCLPRTRETSLLSKNVTFVMGVDEAGRGPLAGPVVAAAAIVPKDIDGITDSKKITKEKDREDLYKAIVESPNVRWAVAIMDAPFIDKVNILQATMRGMEACSTALAADAGPLTYVEIGDEKVPILSKLDYEQEGCYVVTSHSSGNSNSNNNNKKTTKKKTTQAKVKSPDDYRALVDGNRIPPGMPCESESIVKGDSKEYAIAAASILAKVSRDRLMRDYHELWPHFGLDQHKGYPTVAHMGAVRTYGASKIHRRTFKPLKEMTFDEDGKVLSDNSGSTKKKKKK